MASAYLHGRMLWQCDGKARHSPSLTAHCEPLAAIPDAAMADVADTPPTGQREAPPRLDIPVASDEALAVVGAKGHECTLSCGASL